MVNNIFSFLKMLYINNLAEINHIKSFIVQITQSHILMKSIQMAAILDFAQWKNPLRVTKRHPLNYGSDPLWDFKKANKILYNSKYGVQSKYAIWLPVWFGGHLGIGEMIDHRLSYDV